MVTAVIAAAGQGKRMGKGKNKIFIPLLDCPILIHTLRVFCQCKQVDNIIIVVGKDEINDTEELIQELMRLKPINIIVGGDERQHSISNALKTFTGEEEIVIVHDGARPIIGEQIIVEVIEMARKFGACGIGVKVKDTIKVVDKEGFIKNTPDREYLWAIQTPQAFSASLLSRAYEKADCDGYLGTDDAGLVERLGVPVKIVPGSYTNIKITTPEDIIVAEALLTQGGYDKMRVGIGYDVHKLVSGRKLILGGVTIPYELGLDGHSDADVLLHAIKDALLGAAGLGDIGKLFPDNDNTYKGISSLLLLEKVGELLKEKGFRINNIDATVVAQKPKLAAYISEMNTNISKALGINIEMVNVKATTTEGLGFAGRGEGISSYAVVTIIQNKIYTY